MSLHIISDDVFKVSRRLASSLSLLIVEFIALICLCHASVKADDAASKKAEYGTVIGIGKSP